MAEETGAGPTEGTAPATSPLTDAITKAEDAKKPEDLVGFAQTPETNRALASMTSDIKVPQDLSKVSEAKARELAEAGLVEDRDLPGKMYKRTADGFVTRIPDYTYNAYGPDLKAEWEEIKLVSDDKPKP